MFIREYAKAESAKSKIINAENMGVFHVLSNLHIYILSSLLSSKSHQIICFPTTFDHPDHHSFFGSIAILALELFWNLQTSSTKRFSNFLEWFGFVLMYWSKLFQKVEFRSIVVRMGRVAQQNQRDQQDKISFENHLKYEPLWFRLYEIVSQTFYYLLSCHFDKCLTNDKMMICVRTLECLIEVLARNIFSMYSFFLKHALIWNPIWFHI